MIDPTDEMYEALFDAGEASGGEFASKEDVMRGLAAVLAIVERDWCVEPRGHVDHPLWPSGRGGSHPHFCVSCSHGGSRGLGCHNCRQTGFDQTPWPDCRECAS